MPTIKFNFTDRYPVTPNQAVEAFCDPVYQRAKSEALGDPSFELLEHSVTGNSIVLKTDRTRPMPFLPAAAAALGGTVRIIQTETWNTRSPTKTATVEAEVKGFEKLLKITVLGEIIVEPVGDSECDGIGHFEIFVKTPVTGTLVAGAIAGAVRADLDAVMAFNAKVLKAYQRSDLTWFDPSLLPRI